MERGQMSNLLVIDFDYFFYNPLYAVHGDDERFWLFDWGHSESSSLYLDMIWPIRAASFLKYDFELPQVEVPANWWGRFNISEDAIGEVSDSNMYSGVVNDGEHFDHVWLFDAHHDLFKIQTEEQLREFRDKGDITCEDWMFAHYIRGSKLHWRWPKWFDYGKNYRKDIPKWVGCDARRDDLGKLDPRMQFDAVSICRSGAWVPPWCDEQFEQLYTSCPVMEMTQVDDLPLRRGWSMELAQQNVEALKRMDAEVEVANSAAQREATAIPVVIAEARS
jgi:hypothetical protein